MCPAPCLLFLSAHEHFGDFSCSNPLARQIPLGNWNSRASFSLDLGYSHQDAMLGQFPLILVHPGPSGSSFPSSPLQTPLHLAHCILAGSLFSVKWFEPFVFLFYLKLTTFSRALGYLKCSQGSSNNILINCLATLFQSNGYSQLHPCFPMYSSVAPDTNHLSHCSFSSLSAETAGIKKQRMGK